MRVRFVVLAIALIVACGLNSFAYAGQITVGPPECCNAIPFGSEGMRYQQVYDTSIFAGPQFILSVAFSIIDNPNSPFSFDSDIRLRFGHTDVAVGALSTVLDSNITSPLTTVFDGTLFLSTPPQPGSTGPLVGGQDSFGVVFQFDSPFSYDPTQGNLLMEINILRGSETDSFFAIDPDSIITSRAWQTLGQPGLTDEDPIRTGLYTRFIILGEDDITVPDPIDPIPEPATLFLLGSGLIAGAAFRKKT